MDKYFNQLFVADNVINGYAVTMENGKFNENGLQVSGSVKPFANDFLVLKINVNPVSIRMTSNDGKLYV